MIKISDSARGAIIVLMGMTALLVSVSNARSRFIVDDSPSAKSGAVDAARDSHDISPTHVYDRMKIRPGGAIGSVDEVTVTSTRTVIRGWIVGPDRHLARRVIAIVDGTVRYDITHDYGFTRPDVALYLKQTDARDSGIVATLSNDGMTKGKHRITFAVVLANDYAITPISNARDFFVY